MTEINLPDPARRQLLRSVTGRHNLPLAATVAVCLTLYVIASVSYDRFFSLPVFVNLVQGHAFLGVTAVGMTFVILSGGIDLSVGAVIACSTVLIAVLVENFHLHPLVAIPIVLCIGTAYGAGMGCLIRFFNVPAFLVTLGGMFLARGAGLVILPTGEIPLTHPAYRWLLGLSIPISGRVVLSLQGVIFLLVMGVGIVVARFTRFGRNCYAVGGSEPSATLMGLPVGATRISVYAVSGFCSALAGAVATLESVKGDANYATGLELDAIAAVVVGGTVLTGGSGSVIGTFFGVMIFAIMEKAITFDGRPFLTNPAVNYMLVGFLLLVFILLQKLIRRRG